MGHFLFRPVLAFSLGVLALCAAPAHAQSTRSEGAPNDQALRKAQVLLRQAAQETSRLQTENLRLLGEIDALENRLGSATSTLDETERQLAETRGREAASGSRLKKAEEQLARTREQLKEVVTRLKTLTAEHRDLQGTRARLDEQLASREGELAECTAMNSRLHDVGMELLSRYERKGVWDAIAQREPMTGIKQVEIENVLQEYADKIEDQRLDPGAPAAAPDAQQ